MTSPSPVDFFAPATAPSPPAPGWAAPAQQQDESESGLSVATGLVVTGVALAASLLLSFAAPSLIPSDGAADTSLRRAVVVTLGFYVVGGGLLGLFVVLRGVGLVWHRRGVLDALALGVPLGACGGAAAVAINSLSAGHLASDPNVTALVGGGGALRIGLVLVTTAVLAPLVEEVLFRGICAGSLLARGLAPAVWVSAGAFSVWHVNPVALRYYVVMGLVFAGLWRSRGLVASMSAHAAFNGALTLAAVAATSVTYTTTTFGALSLAVPSQWEEATAPFASTQAFEGPSGEGLLLVRLPGTAGPLDLAEAERSLRTDAGAGLAVDRSTVRPQELAIGPAVVADVVLEQQPGHVLLTVIGGDGYEVIMVTGGSPAGERAWDRLLSGLRLAPGVVR